jgi:hypothetical protein
MTRADIGRVRAQQLDRVRHIGMLNALGQDDPEALARIAVFEQTLPRWRECVTIGSLFFVFGPGSHGARMGRLLGNGIGPVTTGPVTSGSPADAFAFFRIAWAARSNASIWFSVFER